MVCRGQKIWINGGGYHIYIHRVCICAYLCICLYIYVSYISLLSLYLFILKYICIYISLFVHAYIYICTDILKFTLGRLFFWILVSSLQPLSAAQVRLGALYMGAPQAQHLPRRQRAQYPSIKAYTKLGVLFWGSLL